MWKASALAPYPAISLIIFASLFNALSSDSKTNIPEQKGYDDDPRVEFVYGTGGEDKMNSSSWILNDYFTRQRKLLGI